ncbi:hypothetical protein HDU67_007755 [Dinochytrium kinnereticum]|nr:hypothetical protein HDU67_007755 [Dinochytrium kinnereticum]
MDGGPDSDSTKCEDEQRGRQQRQNGQRAATATEALSLNPAGSISRKGGNGERSHQQSHYPYQPAQYGSSAMNTLPSQQQRMGSNHHLPSVSATSDSGGAGGPQRKPSRMEYVPTSQHMDALQPNIIAKQLQQMQVNSEENLASPSGLVSGMSLSSRTRETPRISTPVPIANHNNIPSPKSASSPVGGSPVQSPSTSFRTLGSAPSAATPFSHVYSSPPSPLTLRRPVSPMPHGTDIPFALRVMDGFGLRSNVFPFPPSLQSTSSAVLVNGMDSVASSPPHIPSVPLTGSEDAASFIHLARPTTPNPPLHPFHSASSTAASGAPANGTNLQFFIQHHPKRHRRSHSRASSTGSHHELPTSSATLYLNTAITPVAVGGSAAGTASIASSAPSSRSASVDSRFSMPPSPTSPGGAFYPCRMSLRYSRLRSRSWTSVYEAPSYDDLQQIYLLHQQHAQSQAYPFVSHSVTQPSDTPANIIDPRMVSSPPAIPLGDQIKASVDGSKSLVPKVPEKIKSLDTSRSDSPLDDTVSSSSLDTASGNDKFSGVKAKTLTPSTAISPKNGSAVSFNSTLSTVPSSSRSGSRLGSLDEDSRSAFAFGASMDCQPATSLLEKAIIPPHDIPALLPAHHHLVLPSLLQDHFQGKNATAMSTVDKERDRDSERVAPSISGELKVRNSHAIPVVEMAVKPVPTVPPPLELVESHSTSTKVEDLSPKMSSSVADETVKKVQDPTIAKKEMIGRYYVVRTVGAGSFSKVKLAYLPSDPDNLDAKEGALHVAIKMIPRRTLASSQRLRQGLETEISIMKSVSHPSVVELREVIEMRDHVGLVQEFVEGGDLFDMIADRFETLSADSVRSLYRELVEVVAYLHEMRICHRDLKIENVLLTSISDTRLPIPIDTPPPLRIKLTDFGLAVVLPEGVETNPSLALQEQRCGSEEYAAPEVILAQPYDPRRTDVWSLGVILFAMITGELPFSVEPGQRPKAMYHRIARVQYAFPNASLIRMGIADSPAADLEKRQGGLIGLSSEETSAVRRDDVSEREKKGLRLAKELVEQVLQSSPAKRPTARQMLEHPFFRDW